MSAPLILECVGNGGALGSFGIAVRRSERALATSADALQLSSTAYLRCPVVYNSH